MTAPKPRLVIQLFDTFFIIVTCLVVIVPIYRLFNIIMFFLPVFFIYLLKNIFSGDFYSSRFRFSLIDCSLLFIAVAEGISYATSTYRENSFYSLVDISFSILFFYWIKFNLKYDYQRTAIYIFLVGLGVLLSTNGIFYFLSGYVQLRASGFNDIHDFKHILYFGSPPGSPTGEWITIYLAFLPFSLIVLLEKMEGNNHEWLLLLIPAVLILLIPVLSCSRGMYLAVVSFALLGSALFLLYQLTSLRKIILFISIFLFSLGFIVILSPFFKSVVTTVSMVQTISQIRSIEGRKNLWKIGIEMIKDHPFSGIGSYNFPITYITYKDHQDESLFVGRIFNFFLQLSIEKGLIGLFAYCSFIIAFFFISHRKIKLLSNHWNQQVEIILFMSSWAAIVIRDLTYSSILSNKGTFLLLCFMAAHISQLPDEEIAGTRTCFQRVAELKINSGYPYKKAITLIPFFIGLFIFSIIAINSVRKGKAENLLLPLVDQINHGTINKMPHYEEALGILPNNAYYWACLGLSAERSLQRPFNLQKILTDGLAFNEAERGQLRTAIASYKKAIELNPADDWFYHNLGWLYILNKDDRQAEYYFLRAIQIENKSAIYHLSLGLLQEKEEKKDNALKEYGIAVGQLPSLLDSPFFSDLQKRMPVETNQLVITNIHKIEKELQQRDDLTVAARLAKLYYYQGERKKAIFLLERVTKELPGLSRPWLYLGDLYQFYNKDREMIHCYQKSGFLDKSDIFPFHRLGQYYDRYNQRCKAIQCYRNIIHLYSQQRSVHANRVLRLYRSTYEDERYVVNDDLIPNGLLSYYNPTFDLSSVYQRLEVLYKKEDTECAEEN